jgi:glycosyltransferase involved in cell wall biosynthesis
MRIGIHSEAYEGPLGGSEYYVAVLAEQLSRAHSVEIVNHRAEFTVEDLFQAFGTVLDGVTVRHMPFKWQTYHSALNPWRCFQESKKWQAELSEPYDVFVNLTHSLPSFCHAPVGVLVVLFPWFNRRKEGPWRFDSNRLRSRLRRVYYDWEWERRFATYQAKIAISRFAGDYAEKWWNIHCDIVSPPTNTDFELTDKTDAILSVGRFATLGLSKKQLEMMTAFSHIQESVLPDWSYYCVGGLGNLREDIEYFERVRRQNARGGAFVLANLDRPELKTLFERSKIFWHAAGYDEDMDLHPQLAEHFGIATAEAMAAGCVPVVFNQGGQVEIVEHGRTGFLWNTLEELEDFTTLLAGDEKLRQEMSVASRSRAQKYSKDAFARRFSAVLGTLIGRG